MRAEFMKPLTKIKKGWLKGLVASVVLLAGMMTLSSAAPVSAAVPAIRYDGKDASVTFENVTETDLFYGMKGVMPGDTRTQEMLLKSKPVGREASFYLSAECDEATRALLKDVTVSIEANGQTVLENGVVFDTIKLGTVEEKGEMPVKLTMHFPLTLGNEIAEKQLHVIWHITVQEDGQEIAHGVVSSENPGTGRSMATLMPWLVLIVLAALVTAGIYQHHQKTKHPSA